MFLYIVATGKCFLYIFATGNCFYTYLLLVNVFIHICDWQMFLYEFATGKCFYTYLRLVNLFIRICMTCKLLESVVLHLFVQYKLFFCQIYNCFSKLSLHDKCNAFLPQCLHFLNITYTLLPWY